MKHILDFITEKQKFIIKGHTKKQAQYYDVCYLEDVECYGVRLENKEDIDLFIDKAFNDVTKYTGKQPDDGPVKSAKRMYIREFNQGKQLFITIPDSIDYVHSVGFMRYSCFNHNNKIKVVGKITINDFTFEYFKEKKWIK